MNEAKGVLEMEKPLERVAIVIGRPHDFGIGNPDGIPSGYANATAEELQEVADFDNAALVAPNDLSCTACIDGRKCLHNADGSEAKIRLRRVGGSASNLGVALNAEASVVDMLSEDATLEELTGLVDQTVGYESAHLGGCGGANGEVKHNRMINENPAILAAVKVFMEVPVVREYLGVGYSDELGERVRTQAGKTADYLEAKGWNGQAYVDGVAARTPVNVEALDVDHLDLRFHGHRESKITIIVGDLTSEQDDEFVWNLRASKEVAEKLKGERGEEGYQQVLIAEIAKHFAVVHDLPSDQTPIILQVA